MAAQLKRSFLATGYAVGGNYGRPEKTLAAHWVVKLLEHQIQNNQKAAKAK